MEQTGYKRINWRRLDGPQARGEQPASDATDRSTPGERPALGVRWFIIPLSIILCLLQALLTIGASNATATGNSIYVTSTLIPVVGFALLVVLLVLINPMLRLVRLIRPLSRAELVTVFAPMLVTAGIASFGLTDQLIPIVSSPWNPDWNTPQARWDRDALPYLNRDLYLSVPDDAGEEDKQAALGAIETLHSQLFAVNRDDPAQDLAPDGSGERWTTTLASVVNGEAIDQVEFDTAVTKLRQARAGHDGADGLSDSALLQVLQTCQAHNCSAAVIRLFREGVGAVKPLKSDGWSTWWRYYTHVFDQVPWGAWVRPLGYWLVFIFACYGAFYFLSYVVLGHWVNRDKLIFPMVRLTEALLPESNNSRQWVPRALCAPGFWFGFAISFLVLSYNAMTEAQWLGGMTRMNLGVQGAYVGAITDLEFLKGLSGGAFGLNMFVIFTAIGVAFLLPIDVSFSIWFYFWVGKMFILAATWMGFGRTGADFPTMWLWETNMVTSQGAGGLLFFSGVSLVRSVREYVLLARGRTFSRRLQLFVPVIGLVVCLSVLVGWLCWTWLPVTSTAAEKFSNFLWASIFVLFLTLLTLGLMRVVAEGGVYWMQNFGGSFFHFYKSLGLGGWFKTTLAAPLMPIYSVMFLDIKTFIAPNMLNAAKMHQGEGGGGRMKFHLNLMVCIVITVVFSLGAAIYIGHERGANQMEPWFYTKLPREEVMTKTIKVARSAPQFSPVDTAWYAGGGAWVALTMILRRSLFWFPHPIGYIMMINQPMSFMWFSFFIGWIAKVLVVKYGGKSTFDKVRLIFIGLIMGELMAVFFWPMISLLTGVKIGAITLNRYST